MVSLAEGFGFNTNLLETNILNLAVVLPLVFSLGKDTFTKTLDLRLEKILGSLRSADDRFKQAQLELDAAKAGLALAGKKVIDIESEKSKTIEALHLEEAKQYEALYKRYDVLEKETIRLAQEKLVASIRQTLITDAFAAALIGLRACMTVERDYDYTNSRIEQLSMLPGTTDKNWLVELVANVNNLINNLASGSTQAQRESILINGYLWIGPVAIKAIGDHQTMGGLEDDDEDDDQYCDEAESLDETQRLAPFVLVVVYLTLTVLRSVGRS